MIGTEKRRNGFLRRWGLPLGVAALVSATGVLAALAFSGGDATTAGSPVGAGAGGSTTSTATSTPTAADTRTSSDWPTAGTKVLTLGGVPTTLVPPPSSGGTPVDPTSPVITAPPQTPLPADRAAAILASCAPTGGPWQSVLAVQVAHPTKNEDSMVVGRNAKHEYVFCTGLGNAGRSDRSPSAWTMATITTGNSHLKEYDGGTDFSDLKQYLMFNWGLVGPDVAKVTISYGTETKEYPALLAGGAFQLTTATPYNAAYIHPPIGYVHAYAKDGSKLYDTPLH